MKILICGAGALGSNIIKLLVPDLRGKHEITVLDKDKVEERNVTPGTQFYTADQVGVSKVEALQYNVYKHFQRDIDVIHGEIKPVFPLTRMLKNPDLIIDCFDNKNARYCLQRNFEIREGNDNHNLLHVGFSDRYTFAIEWAENYKVPSDINSGFDICEMPGAAAFVGHVASLGALIIEQYINTKKKYEIIGNKFNYQIIK